MLCLTSCEYCLLLLFCVEPPYPSTTTSEAQKRRFIFEKFFWAAKHRGTYGKATPYYTYWTFPFGKRNSDRRKISLAHPMHRFLRFGQTVRERILVAGYDRLAAVFVKEHWEETDFAPHFTIADFFCVCTGSLIEDLQFQKFCPGASWQHGNTSLLSIGNFFGFWKPDFCDFLKNFLGAYFSLTL